ncbi:MAG: hypothetical protein PHX18_08265 [Candidatus Gastranaerophilales bacterium]|nr:hypothetical protein [Candidatus Gastranaerophilales bacterium]
MNRKNFLVKTNQLISEKILEVNAVLNALSYLEQSSYPSNVLLEIATKKLTGIFNKIERTRKFLK